MPRAFNSIIYRLIFFFCIGALSVGIVCPSNSPESVFKTFARAQLTSLQPAWVSRTLGCAIALHDKHAPPQYPSPARYCQCSYVPPCTSACSMTNFLPPVP